MAPLVAKAPGLRSPGHVDGAELALRAVLGQQVSLGAASTHTARLVAAAGTPLPAPDGGLTHLFPEPAALADLDPATLAFPRARRDSITTLIAALACGDVDLGPGADRERARSQLAALPGVGPWTVEIIAMRGLGDQDAFVPTDLGVRLAARSCGLPGSPATLTRHAAAWRPWRAYAVQYLWATGDHAINRMP